MQDPSAIVFTIIISAICGIVATGSLYSWGMPEGNSKGFVGLINTLLRDFRFNFFVVRKFVSALYLVFTAIALSVIVYMLINTPYDTVVSVIAIIGTFLCLVLSRIMLEFVISVIKIAENTSQIAANTD